MERVRPDPGLAEYYHARGEQDLVIDWRGARSSVYNLVRAQSDPFANAYTFLDGRVLNIKRCRLPEYHQRDCGTPGRVVRKNPDGAAVVLCGKSPVGGRQDLEVIEVSLADGLPRPAAEVLSVGKYLGEFSGIGGRA